MVSEISHNGVLFSLQIKWKLEKCRKKVSLTSPELSMDLVCYSNTESTNFHSSFHCTSVQIMDMRCPEGNHILQLKDNKNILYYPPVVNPLYHLII